MSTFREIFEEGKKTLQILPLTSLASICSDFMYFHRTLVWGLQPSSSQDSDFCKQSERGFNLEIRDRLQLEFALLARSLLA